MTESKRLYVCINCNAPATSLYQEYSKNVIRITECEECCEIVDKYIEYDVVLVIMDLILQYIGAYRHLLINTNFKANLRLAVIFLFCGAYNQWIARRALQGGTDGHVYDLEWKFYECLLLTTIEFLVYVATITAFVFVVDRETSSERLNTIGKCSLTGFYGNVFVVLTIIWQLQNDWTYRCLTQLFMIISHVQVHRTLCPRRSVVGSLILIVFATILQKAAVYYAKEWTL